MSILLFGARNSVHVEKNLQRIKKFCSGLKSFPYDDKAAEFYGINRAILEKIGQRIGEADFTISSIALAHDLAIITRNQKEFCRIPGLRIETW